MNYFNKIFAILTITTILSCGWYDKGFDPEMKLSKSDYEKFLSNRYNEKEGKSMCQIEAPIPRLSKIVALPDSPKVNEDKLISVSANDDVPIVDLLLEIGRVANVDIVIDKSITGSTFMSIKNRPLLETLDRICETSDLKYTMKNNTIVVEYDDPYIKTYDVSFLNTTRQSSSSVNVSTSVLSGGNLNGGSTASLSSNSTDTFWEDMEKNIKQIILGMQNESNQKRGIKNNNTSGAFSNISSDITPPSNDSTSQNSNNSSSNNSNNSSSSNSNNSSSNNDSSSDQISLSKSTGMLSIITTSHGHKKIAEYLKKLKDKASAQVLIEVKLAEVILNKQFETGIDLGYLSGNGRSISSTGLSSISSPILSASRTTTIGKGTLTGTLNMLESFGVTKILASPRIAVLNNQQSVLTIADNEVYFDIKIQTNQGVLSATGSGSGSNVIAPTVSVTTDPKTIPVGIVLVLQPSIDLENKSITLTLRPTLSRVKSRQEDPGFNFAAKQAKVTDVPSNSIPITSVREMDSVVSMKSEDIMVMGGFTERQSELTEKGIPFFSKIPLLGWLFSKKIEQTVTKEIVFIIKATIIDSKTDIHEYDEYFYKTFFNDPREFVF